LGKARNEYLALIQKQLFNLLLTKKVKELAAKFKINESTEVSIQISIATAP